MRNGTPLYPILLSKVFGSGGGSVTPEDIVTATGEMTDQQKSDTRANIGATDALTSIPDDVKQALLNCFSHVAWIDEHGQDYYDELSTALYCGPLQSISAVFTQGANVIYDTDTLDDLKQYLVVTAHYSVAGDVIVTGYDLSGTLTEGTSTITVSFGGKTTTFDVTVSAHYLYKLSNGSLTKITGACSGGWTGSAYIMTDSINRRAFISLVGIGGQRTCLVSADSGATFSESDYYFIPVPNGAKKVAGSITPSSQYFNVSEYYYDTTVSEYRKRGETGWKQGSYTYTLSENSGRFIGIHSKYDSAGSSYPTEPTEVVVQFLTE